MGRAEWVAAPGSPLLGGLTTHMLMVTLECTTPFSSRKNESCVALLLGVVILVCEVVMYQRQSILGGAHPYWTKGPAGPQAMPFHILSPSRPCSRCPKPLTSQSLLLEAMVADPPPSSTEAGWHSGWAHSHEQDVPGGQALEKRRGGHAEQNHERKHADGARLLDVSVDATSQAKRMGTKGMASDQWEVRTQRRARPCSRNPGLNLVMDSLWTLRPPHFFGSSFP